MVDIFLSIILFEEEIFSLGWCEKTVENGDALRDLENERIMIIIIVISARRQD